MSSCRREGVGQKIRSWNKTGILHDGNNLRFTTGGYIDRNWVRAGASPFVKSNGITGKLHTTFCVCWRIFIW